MLVSLTEYCSQRLPPVINIPGPQIAIPTPFPRPGPRSALRYFGMHSISEFNSLFVCSLVAVLNLSAFREIACLMRVPLKERFGDILDRLRRHSRDADDNARAIDMLRNSEYHNGRSIAQMPKLNLTKK